MIYLGHREVKQSDRETGDAKMKYNGYEIENGKFESNKDKFSVVDMCIWCATPDEAVAEYERLARESEGRELQRQAYVKAAKAIASKNFSDDDVITVFGEGSTVNKKKIECAAAALGLKWKKVDNVVKKCKVMGVNGAGNRFYDVTSAVSALQV